MEKKYSVASPHQSKKKKFHENRQIFTTIFPFSFFLFSLHFIEKHKRLVKAIEKKEISPGEDAW